MRRGVGHLPLADPPVPPVGADVVLVAELRDRQVDLRLAVLARFGLRVLDRPTRVPILLPELGGLALPILGDAALLRRRADKAGGEYGGRAREAATGQRTLRTAAIARRQSGCACP